MNDEQKKPTPNEQEVSRKPFKSSGDVNQALESFNKTTVEAPKKKSNWVMLVVLPVVIVLGLYAMISLIDEIHGAEQQWSFQDLISNINVKHLVIVLAVMLGIMLLESIKYLIVTHAVTNKFKPLDSIKVAFVGKYYDDITPFSAGGQPMQIVYLHRKGHSAGTASAIILIKYFIQMMCWVTICLLLMTINQGALDRLGDTADAAANATRHILVIGGWIGWCVNAILPLSIIFFAIFPKFTNKVLEFFINIIINVSWRAANRKEKKTGKSQLRRKIKLVRRKRKWIDSANTAVKDFRSSFVVMGHKPAHFISLVLSCVAEQLLTWAFPFFVLIAFDKGQTPTWDLAFAIMTLNVYSAMTVTVVPTPGNSGLMEVVMGAALMTILGQASVWVLVGWRMSTYYIYIVVGIFITIFEFIRKIVRDKRQKSKLSNPNDRQ